MLAITLAATWELLGLAAALGHRPHRPGGLVAAALLAAASYTAAIPLPLALAVAVALPLLLALARADLSRGALSDISVTIASAAIPAGLLGFVMRMRLLEAEWSLPGHLVLLFLVTTWGSDSGAYFVGRALGRTPMAPRVSPKKTWEGFAGGVAGAIAGAFLYRALLWPSLGPRHSLSVGAIVAFLGPLGDLAESVLKRSASVKDSGVLFPGHGGALDRVDSLLFAAPVLYYYYRHAL